jgi:large subunit ribosomal protein L28
MPLLPPKHPSLTHLRTFTSSAHHHVKFEHTAVPPYPYGPSQFYKQSNFGLYGNQKIRFGNMVSEKNEIKTRRYWRPNVHSKRLWSECLGTYVRLRITTRVLRTVDKVGGLDEYLLGEKAGRIKELGMGGWKLRWRIMQTEKCKERFRAERVRLGLPPKEEVLVGSDGMVASQEEVDAEINQIDEDLLKGQNVDIGEEGEGTSAEEGFMQEEPPRQEKVLL